MTWAATLACAYHAVVGSAEARKSCGPCPTCAAPAIAVGERRLALVRDAPDLVNRIADEIDADRSLPGALALAIAEVNWPCSALLADDEAVAALAWGQPLAIHSSTDGHCSAASPRGRDWSQINPGGVVLIHPCAITTTPLGLPAVGVTALAGKGLSS